MKSFAISFKGGASRGLGAIGIIRFLQEENIVPKIVAGSSSGAIIAAAYSLGYQWNYILKFASDIRLWKLFSLKSIFTEGSFVSERKYRSKLLSLHEDVNIENLPIKLIVFATDIKNNKRVFIEKGSLVNALIASSSYPPIFPQISVEGYKRSQLIDGDFILGYSVKKLKETGVDKVFGVSFKNSLGIKGQNSKNLIRRYFESNSLLFNVIGDLNETMDPVDLSLIYEIGSYNLTNFQDISIIVDKAYKLAKKNKLRILELLA